MSKLSINSIIRAAIIEALEGNKEQKPQQAERPAETPQPPQQNTSVQDNETKEKLASADIETDDIIEKLNSIRSGRSFKDSSVEGPMQQYVDELDAAEKTALYAFLQGLAQIVTGEIPGDAAVEPKDSPADVQMKKAVEPKTPEAKTNKATSTTSKTVQPTVKKSAPSSPRAEDTSSPTPIKVQKR
jgi:hypothetical protein